MAKKDWMIIESELDEDQIKVLIATIDKSCLVSGCAGSGKSVLALIKAQRIQREKGDNYQIIVFTKTLCRYMNAGRKALGLHKDFYYHWHWKNRLYCPKADYVIVDEIQDFAKEEIEDFIGATNKNFSFFGDTAQSIYDGLKNTMPVHEINRLFSCDKEPKNFSLYRNYRLPIPTARIAQYIGLDLDAYDEKTYKSKRYAVPKFIQYNSLDEQIEAIARIISRDNGLTDVAILLPHNEDVRHVSTLLNSKGVNHEARYSDNNDWRNNVDNLDFNTTNPKVMTYHSAKGLQFETVFLPNISPLSSDSDRRRSEQKALYVAMTRTYQNLYVMYSGILPAPLSTVPSSLFTNSETDTIEEI
jgi:superfamily I DNA/RNA helicase